MEGYKFPVEKLKTVSEGKTPLVLIACGSFSPITHMHLRLFELALDAIKGTEYEVVGAYMSPVTDAYGKKGLESAKHRLAMCKAATDDTMIMIDDFESRHTEFLPTRNVLDHFETELTKAFNGVRPHINMLCGADLLDSFNRPGLWAEEDMDRILGHYGLICVQRDDSDAASIVKNNTLMSKYTANIRIINQWMNDITSSTKLRYALSQGYSIRYLTPDPVIKYIYDNGLYGSNMGPKL